MTVLSSKELFDHCISADTPQSVVRYGDGEAIILNGFKDSDTLNMIFKRQYGFVPATSVIDAVRSNLIEAYKGADLIGMPLQKREGLNSYWYKAADIFKCEVGEEVFNEKVFTSVDFHTDWLTAGYYEELISRYDRLCYISCRDLDQQLKSHFGIQNIYSFQVAPESKFTSGWKGDIHYPTQLNQIEKWMKEIPVKGSLCLVGAGFTGKIYNTWFKSLGGISYDVGSVFDLWAGLATRGTNRGLDKIDETFKL